MSDEIPLALHSSDGDFAAINQIPILDTKSFSRSAPITSLLAVLLPLIYASIHLGAWGFEFPTPAEALCWKIACFDIAVTTPALLTVEMALVHWRLSLKEPLGHDATEIQFRMISNSILCSWVLFLAYLIARTFIIVEAFISLRSVPIGVYLTPSWLQMIPHL